ncbi:hypothetical protein BDB01DRAFT_835351 [Pilobolus umbonatus]|nr:hypothetical protein BDB01DRAFT_835351 [Pilobolus umbonatus]
MPKRTHSQINETTAIDIRSVEVDDQTAGMSLQTILDGMKKMKEENKAMKEAIMASNKETTALKETVKDMKEEIVALKEIIDNSDANPAHISDPNNTIPPPVSMGLLNSSHWKAFLMDSSIFTDESHLSKVPAFLNKGKGIFKSVCDTYMEVPEFSGKVWGELTSRQRTRMKKVACDMLLEQCPELEVVRSCRELWPISAAIQPKWINNMHYKRVKASAEADRLELAALRSKFEAAEASSSTH